MFLFEVYNPLCFQPFCRIFFDLVTFVTYKPNSLMKCLLFNYLYRLHL